MLIFINYVLQLICLLLVYFIYDLIYNSLTSFLTGHFYLFYLLINSIYYI